MATLAVLTRLTLMFFANLLVTLTAAIIDAKRDVCERLDRINRQPSNRGAA
jgi:hypothetical protein